MCVTGMTSTGSKKRLPFPGREGEETMHRGEGTQLHTGDHSRSFTEDACSLFWLPSLHSFYIITLPRHPGGLFWFKSSPLSVCTHSLLRDWNERCTLHPHCNRHMQLSHDCPIHSHSNVKVLGLCNYPCGVWVQESSCSIDTYNYPLCDRSAGQSQLTSPPRLCFLTSLWGAAFSFLSRTSVPHRSHPPNICFNALWALQNKSCLLPCVRIVPSRARVGNFQLLTLEITRDDNFP